MWHRPGQGAPSNAKGGVWSEQGTGAHLWVQRRARRTAGVAAQLCPLQWTLADSRPAPDPGPE